MNNDKADNLHWLRSSVGLKGLLLCPVIAIKALCNVGISKRGNKKNVPLNLHIDCNPVGIYNAGKFWMQEKAR
jgi:hypothetical protein